MKKIVKKIAMQKIDLEHKLVKVRPCKDLVTSKFNVHLTSSGIYDADREVVNGQVRYLVHIAENILFMCTASQVKEVDMAKIQLDKIKDTATEAIISKANRIIADQNGNGITTGDELVFLLGELNEVDEALADIEASEDLKGIENVLDGILGIKATVHIMSKYQSEKV